MVLRREILRIYNKLRSVSAYSNTSCIPFPNRRISDSSKLKEFGDDNFKFDENGRNLSKTVETNVGKAEIAHDEQFLLFPQCFKKTFDEYTYKTELVWERVRPVCLLSHRLRIQDRSGFANCAGWSELTLFLDE